MSDELWAFVNGYDGSYMVSSNGTVISTPRVTTRIEGDKVITQPLKGRTLKQGTGPAGHKTVNLCKDGKATATYVHSLVAESFIGPRPIKHQVCHNDGVPGNNRVENLRYDTPKGNAADRVKHGTDAIGINNPSAKYSNETIKYIKDELESRTAASIARELNIPKSTVRGIKQGCRQTGSEKRYP